MVKIFRDFIQWKFNRNIEKGIIDTYERLLETVTDKNVRGVINNNLVFYRQGQAAQNTHELLKMMDQTLENEYRMTKKQRNLIHLNKLSVLLRKGRFPQAHKLLKEIEAKEDQQRDIQFIKNKYFWLKKNKDPQLAQYVGQVKNINNELGYCLRVDM